MTSTNEIPHNAVQYDTTHIQEQRNKYTHIQEQRNKYTHIQEQRNKYTQKHIQKASNQSTNPFITHPPSCLTPSLANLTPSNLTPSPPFNISQTNVLHYSPDHVKSQTSLPNPDPPSNISQKNVIHYSPHHCPQDCSAIFWVEKLPTTTMASSLPASPYHLKWITCNCKGHMYPSMKRSEYTLEADFGGLSEKENMLYHILGEIAVLNSLDLTPPSPSTLLLHTNVALCILTPIDSLPTRKVRPINPCLFLIILPTLLGAQTSRVLIVYTDITTQQQKIPSGRKHLVKKASITNGAPFKLHSNSILGPNSCLPYISLPFYLHHSFIILVVVTDTRVLWIPPLYFLDTCNKAPTLDYSNGFLTSRPTHLMQAQYNLLASDLRLSARCRWEHHLRYQIQSFRNLSLNFRNFQLIIKLHWLVINLKKPSINLLISVSLYANQCFHMHLLCYELINLVYYCNVVSDYTYLGRSIKRYEPLLTTGVAVQDSSGLCGWWWKGIPVTITLIKAFGIDYCQAKEIIGLQSCGVWTTIFKKRMVFLNFMGASDFLQERSESCWVAGGFLRVLQVHHTAKKNFLSCLQLTCSILQPSCHPNSTLFTVTVHQSLVKSLLKNGWSNNRSFLGVSASQLQAVEQVFFFSANRLKGVLLDLSLLCGMCFNNYWQHIYKIINTIKSKIKVTNGGFFGLLNSGPRQGRLGGGQRVEEGTKKQTNPRVELVQFSESVLPMAQSEILGSGSILTAFIVSMKNILVICYFFRFNYYVAWCISHSAKLSWLPRTLGEGSFRQFWTSINGMDVDIQGIFNVRKKWTKIIR
ncbi:hypothetical protein VP01_395g2 [Puccinia sorghi]|uniref:Uncharacterized protein n=1 Tax=Puccinia sorghi TaxID=27349 RepID=A0A0L6USB4_9BASI|nr:hypothetical protein VP01_395g2 [Puccinia sorghi]